MDEIYYIGVKVKYKINPNQIEIIFEIKDFNVYVDANNKISVSCEISPDKDYILEGSKSFYSKDYVTEANVLDLILVKSEEENG